MSSGLHSLRNDDTPDIRHEGYAALLAEGFEPDLEGAVTGDQFELLLMYPSSVHSELLQKKMNPKDIQRLPVNEAVICAIIQNKRQENGDGSLWIDDVESKLIKALGYDKQPIAVQRDLVQFIPCVTSSLDAHYGVDAFALAWKSVASADAQVFRSMIERAKLMQQYLDKYQSFAVNLAAEKEMLVEDIRTAASLLNNAMEKGKCAMATMDATENTDKEYATFDSSLNMQSTKSDLLVDLRGGILHRDFERGLTKRSNGTFESRVIEAKTRRSRRTYIARALKVILEWKWDAHPTLSSNMRMPGAEATWINQRTSGYNTQMRRVLGSH
jgi:hypothetical protein